MVPDIHPNVCSFRTLHTTVFVSAPLAQVVGRLLYRQPTLLPALLDGNAEAEGRWEQSGVA